MTGLDAHVVVRRPGHVLDVALTAEPNEVVAVVGPNGAGKSTLVRALAGLVPLDEGHVRLGEDEWEVAGSARRRVHEREVGMAFQSGLLFPHLSARRNVAFGLRSKGQGRAAADRHAQEWLDRLGVGELAARRPGRLSGGQAQRVSLARALAPRPRLLLLDEPLSALDVSGAARLRTELVEVLGDVEAVTLVVTHDALDAMTLADSVLVLDEGRVAQSGSPDDVARHPRTDHVARMVGLNVLRGRSEEGVVVLPGGDRVVTTSSVEGPVDACFSPVAVTLTTAAPTGSARNRWHGPVVSVVPHGSAVRVHVDAVGGLLADVTPASARALRLTPGASVWASVKATEISVYGRADRRVDSAHA